jgi:hypothetical protein
VSDQIIIYESHVLPSIESSLSSHLDRLAILFHRQSLPDMLSLTPQSDELQHQDRISYPNPLMVEEPFHLSSHLAVFNSVQNYSGFFISGAFPRWVFLDQDHGSFYSHPMWCDGGVSCFTALDHEYCSQGFAYITHKVSMSCYSIVLI